MFLRQCLNYRKAFGGILINSVSGEHDFRTEQLEQMTGILCESTGWRDITKRPTSDFFQPFGDLYLLHSLDVRYIENCSGSDTYGNRLAVVYAGDNLLLIPYSGSRRVIANKGHNLTEDVYAVVRKDEVIPGNEHVNACMHGVQKIFSAINNKSYLVQPELGKILVPLNYIPPNYLPERNAPLVGAEKPETVIELSSNISAPLVGP